MSVAAEKTEIQEETLSAAEFAEIIVDSRREAIGLSVAQIQQLAASVLIIDHQLGQANRMMATMMVAEASSAPPSAPVAKPEFVHVPLVIGGDPKLTAALEALVKARARLEHDRFSSEENQARQTFEKVAFAVADICTPKPRK